MGTKPAGSRTADEYAELYSMLVRQLREQVKGHWESASKLRRKTIRFAKKLLRAHASAKVWLLLGDAYVRSGPSEKCYAKAFKMDPRNGEAAFELARIAHYSGDIRRAVAMINLAVRYLPEDIEFSVMSLAAQIYTAAGDPVRARRAEASAERYRKKLPKQPVRELDPDWDKT